MDKSLEDDSQGLRCLAGVTPIFVLGLLCFSARIISRLFPTCRLKASDYVNVSAVVAMIVAYSLFVASLLAGFGRHTQFLTHAKIVDILRILFFMKLFSTIGVTLARLSIALQLLLFNTAKAWKAILWGLVALEVVSIVSLILYFLHVRPISVNWDGHYAGTQTATYIFIVVSVLGDLLCLIMPLFLIWDLSRSRLERCLLSLLSALGLCAAAAAIITLVFLYRLRSSADVLRSTLSIYTGCLVEQSALIVASSAPLLKGPVERALSRLGFPGFRNIPRELVEFSSNDVPYRSRWHVTRMWRRRHSSTPQGQGDNTTASKNPISNVGVLPSYKTDASSRVFGLPSTDAIVSMQIRRLERTYRLPYDVGSLGGPVHSAWSVSPEPSLPRCEEQSWVLW